MELKYVNSEMRKGDTLVAAAGTIPSDLTKLFDVKGGKNIHIEFRFFIVFTHIIIIKQIILHIIKIMT